MSGASTQRITQASHPQTKETLVAVGKGVNGREPLPESRTKACLSELGIMAYIPRTYASNPKLINFVSIRVLFVCH
jgi:hypothetical protein